MKELRELTAGLSFRLMGPEDRIITGIAYDSRSTRTGNIFVALRGEKFDGHKYITVAIENGAGVIVHDRDLPVYQENITYLRVDDARTILPLLAARFYNYPADEMIMIGVTGTNGKTTTTYYIQHLLAAAHLQAAVIGTTGIRYAGQIEALRHTTPESVDLQAILNDLTVHGCKATVMEVSSHALIQHRADEIHFQAGVFTNLTQDHLDYHGTMENYAKAKQILFTHLPQNALAIINGDDSHADLIVESTSARVVRYGRNTGAAYQLTRFEFNDGLTRMSVNTPNGPLEFSTNVVGLFNGLNLLAALATVLELGYKLEKVKPGLMSPPPVRGRMQQVGKSGHDRVFVDYAHTPDAMETVLKVLHQFYPQSRLITVFGCGGDRDKSKRQLMGKVATELSDYAIITDDNPRSESTEGIIRDILAGCVQGRDFEVIPHRKGAIQRALSLAGSDDVVAILGKGHETYQEIRGVRYPFDDAEVISHYQAVHGS